MIETPVAFKGAPGSPYTRKMMAIMRYRRIPYQFLIGDQASREGYPEPKVSLLPTFYLKGDSGELEAVVDSTPLIRRFESAFDERRVLPGDPVLGFINYLLEDFGDEWLTKAMFHYRWHFDADVEQGGKILPLWRNLSMDPARHEAAAKQIAERQVSRLYVVGSNDVTAPVIEDSYRRFLDIMDRLLQRRQFLMGDRPGSSDFALYAQLTQLAGFDPTPRSICLERAPRVFAWTDVVDDLSGLEASNDAWLPAETIDEHLGELLVEAGRVYAPALIANARAIAAGGNTFETTIDGRPWQQPAFPYQAKCLGWIRDEFTALDETSRSTVRELLAGTGCEALVE